MTSTKQSRHSASPGRVFLLGAFGCAVVLTLLFWGPLWTGGGFVGGDVYSYYFPQKTFYAESLQAGEFPLWNNRTGHGYPLVGESQTGPFYPFHLAFYSVLDANTAYNVNHLLHYILAFVFMALYARQIGLTFGPALLMALVYTYGWFPSRNCVEWAIIGGAWFPAALWCVERFLNSRLWRYAIALAAILSLQMLAGHFEIAFITQITLAAYIPIRIWWARSGSDPDAAEARRRMALILTAAVFVSFGLSAAQLAPTWELRQMSQRADVGDNHELGFGSIPVWYYAQTFLPFKYYSPLFDRNDALQDNPPIHGDRTNEVEAHLYFGVVPLVMALASLIIVVRSKDRLGLLWFALGISALVYTSGCLVPIAKHLPGFSYFQGPGRYGIVTTAAVAYLAGIALQQSPRHRSLSIVICLAVIVTAISQWSLVSDVEFLLQEIDWTNPLSLGHWSVGTNGIILWGVCSALVGTAGLLWRSQKIGSVLLLMAVLCISASDLWITSRLIRFSQMVADPPITHLQESPVRQVLTEEPGVPRLFAPGANFPNVLGVASTPVYLTFGPQAYTNPKLIMPNPPETTEDQPEMALSTDQIDWLQQAGVTHILSFKPVNESSWPVELVWRGDDPVLNRAWARAGQPLYLYRLNGNRGRVAWSDPAAEKLATITNYSANEIVLEVDSPDGGELILTDLTFPGWSATIDGAAADAKVIDGMYRSLEILAGQHRVLWKYEPRSVYWGAAVSVATLLFLAAVAHVCFWHPAQMQKFLPRPNAGAAE